MTTEPGTYQLQTVTDPGSKLRCIRNKFFIVEPVKLTYKKEYPKNFTQ